MASLEMASFDTWAFQPTFDNSWISEIFTRETDVLTKVFTQSITNVSDNENVSFTETPSSFLFQPGSSTGGSDPEPEPETKPEYKLQSIIDVSGTGNVSFLKTPSSFESFPTQPGSSSGGSDLEPEPETKPECETQYVSKRQPRNVMTKKITKRKTRASKRSNTTFINADPANFRQMVQQVTGVRFGSVSGLVLKPEPQRVVSGSGYLPTLDTSAFLLEHHQQAVGSSNVVNGSGFGSNVSSTNGPGFDFDGLTCFPTLESWKVM